MRTPFCVHKVLYMTHLQQPRSDTFPIRNAMMRAVCNTRPTSPNIRKLRGRLGRAGTNIYDIPVCRTKALTL